MAGIHQLRQRLQSNRVVITERTSNHGLRVSIRALDFLSAVTFSSDGLHIRAAFVAFPDGHSVSWSRLKGF